MLSRAHRFRRHPWIVGVGVVVAAIGLLSGVAMVARSGGGEHVGAGDRPKFEPNPTQPVADNEHGAGHAPVALSAADEGSLAAELKELRRAVTPYRTVADAQAAGFVAAGGDTGRNDTHLVRWDRMDGQIRLGEPEMLLAASGDAAASIVAVVYYQATSSEMAPQGFAGVNDHWHEHRGLCVVDQVVVAEGDETGAADCTRRGGRIGPTDGWMLHVWAVEGHENPDGLFVPENPLDPLG